MDIKMNKSVFLGVGAVCLVLLALGVFALVQQYSFCLLYTSKVDKVSASAKAKIEAAGGKVEEPC